VDQWAPFVSRLTRSRFRRVYLSGSSAKMLSKEIPSEMRGRSISVEIFPPSFRELLTFRKTALVYNTPEARGLVRQAFSDYLLWGSYPETIFQPPFMRRKILQEYIDVLLFRDIIERNKAPNPELVRALSRILIAQSANLYTINKLHARLSSLGVRTGKENVSSVISWFEDAYFLFSVPIFDPSISKQLANPRKIYCLDNGLLTLGGAGFSRNRGQLFENLVFLNLRRRQINPSYLQTAAGLKVDFVYGCTNGSYQLIQVCESLSAEETRKRELRALRAAMEELALREATVITLDENELIEENGRTIRVVPAWRYLLEQPAL
jgi:hypothetical protein